MTDDIFSLTVLLKEYCSQNTDTQEMECIYAFSKVLNTKADDLTFKVEELIKGIYINTED